MDSWISQVSRYNEAKNSESISTNKQNDKILKDNFTKFLNSKVNIDQSVLGYLKDKLLYIELEYDEFNDIVKRLTLH